MTRQELSDKYFHGCKIHAKGNLGIISLLSDVQHGTSDGNEVVNDIKKVLIADHRELMDKEETVFVAV